jgi:hypothetical protein
LRFVKNRGPPSPARQQIAFTATEDKDALVRPLAEVLRERGLAVWYDEFELRLGDSLRRKIDAGPARSRFGVAVLSPASCARTGRGTSSTGS